MPAAARAQAWRNHQRQNALHVLLDREEVIVVPLDLAAALRAGTMCASSATSDVVDASVVVCAHERGDVVIASDPGDISALDPSIRIFTIQPG